MVLLAICLVIGLYYLVIGGVLLRSRISRAAHLLWQFPLNGPRDLVPDMLEGGIVSCGSQDGLYWVDPAGQEIAHVPVPADEMLVAWISQGNLSVLTGSESASGRAQVQGFDRLGQPLWTYEMPGRTDSCWISLSADSVLVQRNVNELFKLSHSGELVWYNRLPVNSSFVSLAPDGRILTTDQNGDLQVYSPDFRPLGKGRGLQHYMYFAGATLPVYLPDGSCRISDNYSLSAVSKEGTLQWQHAAYSSRSPSLNPFTLWLQSLSGSGAYYGPSSWYGASLPAVGPDGTSYYGTPDGTFFAVDASGKGLWSKALRGAVRGAVVGKDGTVYVVATNSGVLAYTPQGRLRWRNTGLRPIASAIALGTNGKLYVETDKALCCLDP